LYGADFRNIFNQTPLMIAAWMGNAEVIKALIERGSDTEKVDSNGLTAFQIALAQANRNENYAKKKLAEIYEQLESASLSIQIDERLIKLDRNSMEFFMFNLMMALFYRVMPHKLRFRVEGFSTQDFMEAVQHIPNCILPERRKQRAYLSSILSKNEMDKDDRYNRKLFYRVLRGAYIFNPGLAIKIEGEWINIYDLLKIDRLIPHDFINRFDGGVGDDYIKTIVNNANTRLKQLIAEKRVN